MAIVPEHAAVVEALRDALLERDELVGSEITDVIASSLLEAARTELTGSLYLRATREGARCR